MNNKAIQSEIDRLELYLQGGQKLRNSYNDGFVEGEIYQLKKFKQLNDEDIRDIVKYTLKQASENADTDYDVLNSKELKHEPEIEVYVLTQSILQLEDKIVKELTDETNT